MIIDDLKEKKAKQIKNIGDKRQMQLLAKKEKKFRRETYFISAYPKDLILTILPPHQPLRY